MRCYIRRLAHRLNPMQISVGEVVQMWKERIFKGFLFLTGTAILMYLSAINAC